MLKVRTANDRIAQITYYVLACLLFFSPKKTQGMYRIKLLGT